MSSVSRTLRSHTIATAMLCVVSVNAVACGPKHVAPFTPRERVYKAGHYAQEGEAARRLPGSLFSEASTGYLLDTRALRVGDFVVIRIDENADAQGGATTRLTKESATHVGTDALLGMLPALKAAYPTLDPTKLLDFASKSSFQGDGNTARRGLLTGSIAVRVVREMPNGDLFLEGTKVILINSEETHLYISGLARTADISPDNTLASSRLADAQVEFTGRGDLADNQTKGWLSRLADIINPF